VTFEKKKLGVRRALGYASFLVAFADGKKA
jgi:hypothetical protein